MRSRGIRRGAVTGIGFALVAAFALVVAFALAPGVASASGGGGCGGPVTEATGTTVEIEEMCFGPTILRVATGEDVTFVNRDGVPHTVLGANGAWGSFDALKRGAEATYAFSEPGVYPYVCTWHVGMVGAIVAGDGVGGAFDTTTSAGPVTQGSERTELTDAAPASAIVDDGAGWIAVAAAIGLLVGTVGAIGVRRIRGRSLA